MPRFLYTVWFLDPAADTADEDREWPACLLVEAADAATAQAWGDVLARGRAGRPPALVFLHSAVETTAGETAGMSGVPLVRAGEAPDDAALGW